MIMAQGDKSDNLLYILISGSISIVMQKEMHMSHDNKEREEEEKKKAEL